MTLFGLNGITPNKGDFLRKILFLLLLLFTFVSCSNDPVYFEYTGFNNLPDWANGLELKKEADHDGWSIHRDYIKHYAIDGTTKVFTPDNCKVLQVKETCFIIITDFEDIRFELNGQAVIIKWYYTR